MTMHTRFAAGLTLLGLAALTGFGTAAHAQGLTGQSVHVTGPYPIMANPYTDFGTKTVTTSGTMFKGANATLCDPMNVLVLPSQVVFTTSSDVIYGCAPFNGYHIAEAGASPAVITGVSLDKASNLEGFNLGDVTFDASNVYANFSDLAFTTCRNVTLDLKFGPSAVPAVPEPSAYASFAVGALGLSGLLLRARRKSASA